MLGSVPGWKWDHHPGPQQWKLSVLTTGPPGNSPITLKSPISGLQLFRPGNWLLWVPSQLIWLIPLRLTRKCVNQSGKMSIYSQIYYCQVVAGHTHESASISSVLVKICRWNHLQLLGRCGIRARGIGWRYWGRSEGRVAWCFLIFGIENTPEMAHNMAWWLPWRIQGIFSLGGGLETHIWPPTPLLPPWMSSPRLQCKASGFSFTVKVLWSLWLALPCPVPGLYFQLSLKVVSSVDRSVSAPQLCCAIFKLPCQGGGFLLTTFPSPKAALGADWPTRRSRHLLSTSSSQSLVFSPILTFTSARAQEIWNKTLTGRAFEPFVCFSVPPKRFFLIHLVLRLKKSF